MNAEVSQGTIASFHQEKAKWGEDDVFGGGIYQICQCLGCDSIRFRARTWSTEDGAVQVVRTFPEKPEEEYKLLDTRHEFPVGVRRMYEETIAVMNAGARVLAGGGLRSIVEAICKHQSVTGKNLQEKIDQLVHDGLLAANQAPILHEARFLGNASLPELQPPGRRELELCLQIIEGLLNAIYVLPSMARELTTGRLAKKKKGKGTK
jgi:hypothetical protein